MHYRLRWFDPHLGDVREELVDAIDEAQLRTIAEAKVGAAGGVLLSTKPERAQSVGDARSGRLDVAWWCRELRTLAQAGMTVVEALETVNAQPLGPARARVNSALVAKLHEGKGLSAAMHEVGGFPAVLIASIRAGERTSSLVEALDDYLRYHDLLHKLRKQVVSAAIYPAVVVGLGMAVSLVLLLFVVPRFSAMYRDLRGDAGTATKLLVALSQALENHGLLIAGALAGLVALVGIAWRQGRIQQVVGLAASRIEPLQRRLDDYRKAKLFQSMALMFRGGYPLDEALAQCAQLGLGPRLEPGIAHARAALARGVRVSEALGGGGLTDEVAARLLAVGERSGNFDRVLATIAERHSGEFATFVERATRIAEPLLLLVVALVVGGIVVMMYMPVFDIASSLG
ncbi:MAG: type II secretion system F family protein [Burkholderiaceae bacterium]